MAGRCRLILLLMAALVAPPAAARAADCTLSLAATLPLTFAAHGSKLLVDVMANGVKLTLIVDTGAENILLTDAAGRKINTRLSNSGRIAGEGDAPIGFAIGVGGSRVVSRIQIDNLALGRMHGAFDAVVTSQLFSLGDHPNDGLLGMSVLGNFDIDMDLAGEQLRLFRATGACSHPTAMLDQPLYVEPLEQGFDSSVRLILPVTINGHNFRAQLDSGSGGTLLFAHTAAVLGLAADGAVPGKPLTASGVGGRTTIFVTHLDTLTVGPLTLRHVPVAVDQDENNPADLLLGLSFMRRVHVWISTSSHSLVLQFPPQASPALAGGD